MLWIWPFTPPPGIFIPQELISRFYLLTSAAPLQSKFSQLTLAAGGSQTFLSDKRQHVKQGNYKSASWTISTGTPTIAESHYSDCNCSVWYEVWTEPQTSTSLINSAAETFPFLYALIASGPGGEHEQDVLSLAAKGGTTWQWWWTCRRVASAPPRPPSGTLQPLPKTRAACSVWFAPAHSSRSEELLKNSPLPESFGRGEFVMGNVQRRLGTRHRKLFYFKSSQVSS